MRIQVRISELLWKNLEIKEMVVYIFLVTLSIILFGCLCMSKKKQRSISMLLNNVSESNDKNWINYSIATKLLDDMQKDKGIAEKISQNGFSSVAVYGMGPIGKFLVKELQKKGIKASYAIDQNAEMLYADVPVYSPKDVLPQTDVVIVTAVYYYKQIKDILEDKVKCPIVSLNDFLL